jgi:hypothetical protein
MKADDKLKMHDKPKNNKNNQNAKIVLGSDRKKSSEIVFDWEWFRRSHREFMLPLCLFAF